MTGQARPARNPPSRHDPRVGTDGPVAPLAGRRLASRKRTLAYLATLSQTREYLTTRYAPEATVASELNRLATTLAEVADKVGAFIER